MNCNKPKWKRDKDKNVRRSSNVLHMSHCPRSVVTAKSGVTIVLQSYSNRYFLIISEAGSQGLGTVIQVVKHQQTNGFEVGPNSTIYDVLIRFGNETPELLLAARMIASKVDFDKPVLFGLALRRFDKELCEEICEEVKNILKTF
ncbi:unnamed protein product [Orchesella dallaii]|uniref:Proteasome assembly chaperone 3 n=1 Tax=Orchesella dallaii TaxID=48710 RepID=A0ABP1RY56_9HEXA